MDRAVTVGALERAIADRFPLARAEQWDRCGLLAGDPEAAVAGVALALDPTAVAIRRAADVGANVLVTHHPAFLDTPSTVTPGGGPGGVLFEALSRGVALINAHTNLDRDADAQALMPDALGLTIDRPLEESTQAMAMVVVYAPADSAEQLRAAMTAEGAGRIGDYRGCSFSSEGVGRFQPAEGASPYVGRPGEASHASEERIEVVCASSATGRVVSAARRTHPYEEPLIAVHDIAIARNASALGMLSSAPAGTTLGRLAALAGERYGCTPRVWGDASKQVTLVASSTGSAGSLVTRASGVGADVLVAGEVRYHDALSALDSGLAVIELGHDVTEWPLVRLLESVVRSIDGLAPEQIHVFEPSRGWWTPKDRE